MAFLILVILGTVCYILGKRRENEVVKPAFKIVDNYAEKSCQYELSMT